MWTGCLSVVAGRWMRDCEWLYAIHQHCSRERNRDSSWEVACKAKNTEYLVTDCSFDSDNSNWLSETSLSITRKAIYTHCMYFYWFIIDETGTIWILRSLAGHNVQNMSTHLITIAAPSDQRSTIDEKTEAQRDSPDVPGNLNLNTVINPESACWNIITQLLSFQTNL